MDVVGPHLLTPTLREMYEASLDACMSSAVRFAEVERFCLFVGYPRSGHTVVASLLEAHPDTAIAIELDALRYVAAGFSREQLFHLLLDRATKKASHTSHEYSYRVEGQWQGRVRRLRVIGDKEAGMTNLRLRWEPDLLDRLRVLVGVPLRVIHVVRNPFDNITTMLTRGDADHLGQAIGTYFRFAATAREVMGSLAREEGLEVHHEDMIAEPREGLARVLRFLGLDEEPEAGGDYLGACASVVMPSPRRTRESIDWPAELVRSVENQSGEIPFLRRYRFGT